MGVPNETFNSTQSLRDRGFKLSMPPLIIIGNDPAGSGDDRDAVVMVAREELQKGEPYDPDFAVITKFRVLAAQRLPQQMEFPDRLARLLSLHRTMLGWTGAGRSSGHYFTVETNGVGYAMASSLGSKLGGYVIPYTTLGNISEKPFAGGNVAMPRLAALDHLRILLETHLIKMAPGAEGGKELSSELAAMVWARPGRPEAMQGQHDDLVLALTGAVWIGSKIIPPILKAQTFAPRSRRN
jgi:hypothetical protein